jgi:hypothetical protein
MVRRLLLLLCVVRAAVRRRSDLVSSNPESAATFT